MRNDDRPAQTDVPRCIRLSKSRTEYDPTRPEPHGECGSGPCQIASPYILVLVPLVPTRLFEYGSRFFSLFPGSPQREEALRDRLSTPIRREGRVEASNDDSAIFVELDVSQSDARLWVSIESSAMMGRGVVA